MDKGYKGQCLDCGLDIYAQKFDTVNEQCETCKEELDQELGCVNCFCIQYWAYDKKDLPTDIKHLRIER